MTKGFLTINDYTPDSPYWMLRDYDKKGNYIGRSPKKLKEEYIEFAVFWLSDYGMYQGVVLEEKATWQLQQGIESPKLLDDSNKDTRTIVLKVEKVEKMWTTTIPNAKNDGLFRVLYNDGDDTYMQAFFATEAEALDCFRFIIDLPFNYCELYDVLATYNFWSW